MALNFKKFFDGIRIVPKTSTTASVSGEVDFDTTNNKFNAHNGTTASPLVTEAHTATLTNKTLTSPVIATITNTGTITLPTSTDTLVGKNTTDILTNKTLTTPTLTSAVVDDGLDLIEESSFSSPVSGKRRFGLKTDGKLYLRDSSGNESVIGQGTSTGINYISNSDAETDTTGWSTYLDAAATTPVDGTGGSANITWTRVTSTPLRGAASFLFTKDAVNRQGQGVGYAFTIADADKFKVLNVAFDYEIASGTYADGDLTCYLFDATNSVIIQPTGYSISNTSIESRQVATFQTSSSTSYRLIFHCASTSAVAYTVKIDNVLVGPSDVTVGAFISEPVDYTPTLTNFTATVNKSKWYRRGDRMVITGHLTFTGVATSSVRVSLPSGYSIDTTKVQAATTQIIGAAQAFVAGTTVYVGSAIYNGVAATSFDFIGPSTTARWAATVPATWANNDTLSYTVEVPILGWGATQVLSADTDTRVVSAYVISTQPTGTIAATIGSSTTISFGTAATRDSHGMYASGVVTVPVPGWYRLSGHIAFSAGSAAAAQVIQVGLYSNGTLQQVAPFYYHSTTVTLGTPFTFLIYSNAGDLLTLRASSGATSPVFGSVTTGHFLNVERLTGPSQIAASETVAARYTTTAGQTITTGTGVMVDYTTKDYDSHGAVTGNGGLTNWRFTAPVSGLYSVRAGILYASSSFTGTNAVRMNLYKGGVDQGVIDRVTLEATATHQPYPSGIRHVKLLAGEYIYALTSHDEAGSKTTATAAAYNYIEILRVGNY